MSSHAEIKPTRKERVIDLVREAGIDVSDWSNSSRGAAGAGMNPKYCYEWAFVEEGKVVVLNLWHEEMSEEDGLVVHRGNFRDDFQRLQRQGGKPSWISRGKRLDSALQVADAQRLPLRVIVNDGLRRKKGDPNATSSKVTGRQLDSEPWFVSAYDHASGEYLLTRGRRPLFVDQFALRAGDDEVVQTRDAVRRSYVRDRAVRDVVLLRARGRCEHCRAPGFRMSDGAIYLETHHIVPLSERGADSLRNIIALCPNHHREAHHGETREALREEFQRVLIALGSQP